jgi:hypothetical protein
MTSDRTFKRDIVYELFNRGDELSQAAGSEILRLRQTMRSCWGIYYSKEEYASDDLRFRAIFRKMHETLSVNPNYPNYY